MKGMIWWVKDRDNILAIQQKERYSVLKSNKFISDNKILEENENYWKPRICVYPFTLTSCAPKVITDIVKVYPVTTDPENVILYEVNDTVPNTAEVIGRVSVVDNGASMKCNYDQVLALAKKETSKNGGNALALTDHKKPSILGSSCHQIAGMMLNINDTVIDSYNPNSFIEAKEIRTERERRMRPTTNTIYANIGYAWITSKYYLPSGASGNPKTD